MMSKRNTIKYIFQETGIYIIHIGIYYVATHIFDMKHEDATITATSTSCLY